MRYLFPLIIALALPATASAAENAARPTLKDTLHIEDSPERQDEIKRRKLPLSASEDDARKKNPPLIDLTTTTIGVAYSQDFLSQVPMRSRVLP